MRVLLVFTALVATGFSLPTFPWEPLPEMETLTEFLTVPLPTEMLRKPVVDCTHEELMTVMTTTLHTTVTTMVPEKCTNLVLARLTTGFVKYLTYNQLDTIYRLLHTHTVEELLTLMKMDTTKVSPVVQTWTNVDTTLYVPNKMTKPLSMDENLHASLVHTEMTTLFEMIKKTWVSMTETTFGTSLATELHVNFPLETPFFSLVRLPTELTHLKTMTVGQLLDHVKNILLPVVTVTDPSVCMTTMTTLELTTMVTKFHKALDGLTVDTMIRTMEKEGIVFPVELKPLLVKVLAVTKVLNPMETVLTLLTGTTDMTALMKPLTTIVAELMTTAMSRTMYLTKSLPVLWNNHAMDLTSLVHTMRTMETMHSVDFFTHFLTRLAVQFSSIGVTMPEMENIMLTVLRDLKTFPMETTNTFVGIE